MKEVELPSGAKLKISLASFSDAKALYQVMAQELKTVKLEGDSSLEVQVLKDLVCAALASEQLEKAIMECAKKSLYNGLKIEESSFHGEDQRQDYIPALVEIAKANLDPFMKGLSARFSAISQLLARAAQQ